MCVYAIIRVCIVMSGCAFVHVGSESEGEMEDAVWRRHIFHLVPFALRGGLPVVLNLCGHVCMWAYQLSAEPEILISFPCRASKFPRLRRKSACAPQSCPRTHTGSHNCTRRGLNKRVHTWVNVIFEAVVCALFDTL